MIIKLNCPVCGYTEIENNSCPNCDTDLSLIRMLQQLPQMEKPHREAKVAGWQLAVTGVILLIGMGLGVLGNFLFLPPQILTATVTSPSPVIIIRPSPTLAPIKPPAPTTYTVKSGDNLSAIAEKFCGKGTSWQVMVKANSQLKGQENYIDVGEVLKVPNCKEGT